MKSIAQYLKEKGRSAWIMNDNSFMFWDKQEGWLVIGNPPYTNARPKRIFYQGQSLQEALMKMQLLENES